MEEEIIDTIPNREREMAVERNPVGDGITDDTAAIQASINHVYAHVPRGSVRNPRYLCGGSQMSRSMNKSSNTNQATHLQSLATSNSARPGEINERLEH